MKQPFTIVYRFVKHLDNIVILCYNFISA